MAASFHSDDHKKFQALLRGVRAELDLTQDEVAQRMGVPQGRISRFESGQRRMDAVELRQWCLAIGFKVDEFFRRFDEAMKRNE